MTAVRTATSGKDLRLARLFRRASGRAFVLPLDHSVSDGPITTARGLDEMVGLAGAAGVDAVVVHKGRVGSIRAQRWRDLVLIVHLSASTRHAADPDAKVLVSSVDDALRLGAEAVSMHVNMGSASESEQLADLGRVAGNCARWQMPLLAMLYPRGPSIGDTLSPALLAHAANLAADLGADVVKIPYTGSAATMRKVVESCPIPLLVAGGPKLNSERDLDDFVQGILDAQAAGVALGRNVFMADDPEAVVRRVVTMMHAEGRTAAVVETVR